MTTLQMVIKVVWMVCTKVMRSMKRCRVKPEVILIAESPQPTRRHCTPCGERNRSPMSPARRAGKRRIGKHALRLSRLYNPGIPHHCGYMCILKAEGKSVGLRAIKRLREDTAEEIYKLYVTYGTVNGINACDIVQQSHMTLAAYQADVRHQQWASSLELAVACDLMGLDIAIKGPQGYLIIGKPKHVIVLLESHYYLYKLHRGIPKRGREPTVARGGMRKRQWTWEEPQTMQPVQEDIPTWALPALQHEADLPPLPVALIGASHPREATPQTPIPMTANMESANRCPHHHTGEHDRGPGEQPAGHLYYHTCVDILVAESLKAKVVKATVRIQPETTVLYMKKRLARMLKR